MEKEKNLIELVNLQHKLIKGFANLVEPWADEPEKEQLLHRYLFLYMDLIASHVLEKKIDLPKHLMDEVNEWASTYTDEERETMFETYHDIMNTIYNASAEEQKEEVSSS